jgi:Fe-S cluster assembly iron-binding protein IscA
MKSFLYLQGVQIDFKDEVMGRGVCFQKSQRDQHLRLRQ